MMLLWFCLGCTESTHPEAFAGVLKRLDRNGDGRVTEAEYIAPKGPPFATADQDGDGNLSAAEVETMMIRTDPAIPLRQSLPPPPRDAIPPPQRELREALRFEVEELRAKVPDASLPSEAEVQAAARQGLGSAAGQQVAAQLRAAATQAGITLPDRLFQALPAEH